MRIRDNCPTPTLWGAAPHRELDLGQQLVLEFIDKNFGYDESVEILKRMVAKQRFKDNPIDGLIHEIIERGVGRYYLYEEPVRTYLVGAIDNFIEKATSSDYLIEFADKYFDDQPNKNAMLQIFKESVEAEDYQSHLKNVRETMLEAIEKNSIFNMGEAEGELRNLYLAFDEAYKLQHYEYGEVPQ
ncbi:MAG: hypothetical protein JHC93_08425 [Parachlamydiales bacterium]|nr:hypothetical protein [Parachlamydiales bacterium]